MWWPVFSMMSPSLRSLCLCRKAYSTPVGKATPLERGFPARRPDLAPQRNRHLQPVQRGFPVTALVLLERQPPIPFERADRVVHVVRGHDQLIYRRHVILLPIWRAAAHRRGSPSAPARSRRPPGVAPPALARGPVSARRWHRSCPRPPRLAGSHMSMTSPCTATRRIRG